HLFALSKIPDTLAHQRIQASLVRPSMHCWIRVSSRAQRLKSHEASFLIVPNDIKSADDGSDIHGTLASRGTIAVRKMQIHEHVAGIENCSSDVCLLRLHVVNIPIDRGDARMTHTSDVSFRVFYRVGKTCLGRSNWLDRGSYSVLGEQIRANVQRFGGALLFDVVVCLGPAHCTGNNQQVRTADGFREGHLPADVVDSVLATYRPVACQIVIG